MFRKIFISTVFIVVIQQLNACGGSYQYRLFPLGMVEGELVVVETSLFRYWNPEKGVTVETRNRWKGELSLKLLNKQGELEPLHFIDTIDILDRDYVDELKPFFEKAIFKVKKLTGFKPNDQLKFEFCNFKKECKTIDLNSSSEDALFVSTKDKNEFKISFPEKVIEQSESSGGIKGQNFKINTIRIYTIGENKLIVANFAFGEDHNTDFKKQTENQCPCNSQEVCIFKELTLYHGLSFDAVLWVK